MRVTCSKCGWSSLPFGGPVRNGRRYNGPARDNAFIELGQHLASAHNMTTVVLLDWLEKIADLPDTREVTK